MSQERPGGGNGSGYSPQDTQAVSPAEEKIRIVVSGLRGEESIAALCRREGIAEGLYFSWLERVFGSGHGEACSAGDTGRQGDLGRG